MTYTDSKLSKKSKSNPSQTLTYSDSGVNIDEGNALVDSLKSVVKSTFDDNVVGSIGSFAGAYALPSGYKEPILLASTDGVGTKLRLAIESKKLDFVGIDLVAMCVNDLICNFGVPLFFLDYYATGRLDKHSALRVIKGIAQGCKIANCALIGGESAEMPSMYANGDFDLAGFSVGIAEREDLERIKSVKEGDILVGFPSSGLHSNGFSLARKVLFEVEKMDFDKKISALDFRQTSSTNSKNPKLIKKPLIDALLEPTSIYVPFFRQKKNLIKSLAHITGGGILENLPRALPNGLGANINIDSIPSQEIFSLLCERVELKEAYRVFNMGVGLIACVEQASVDKILQGSNGFVLGEVARQDTITLKSQSSVVLRHLINQNSPTKDAQKQATKNQLPKKQMCKKQMPKKDKA